MERIYMNRIEGQRRIHIEIDDAEISDLLDDLNDDVEYFASTRRMLEILRGAEAVFSPNVSQGRGDRDAARQAAGQQHTCPDGEPCPGHDEPAAEQQPDTTRRNAILTLAAECSVNGCNHTLNWHRDDGCTICTCQQFRNPEQPVSRAYARLQVAAAEVNQRNAGYNLRAYKRVFQLAQNATGPIPPDVILETLKEDGAAPAVGQQPTQQPATERATVLREAADWFEEHCPDASGGLPLCMCHAADELRRLADGPAS